MALQQNFFQEDTGHKKMSLSFIIEFKAYNLSCSIQSNDTFTITDRGSMQSTCRILNLILPTHMAWA